ncbi:MAG: hypothetical protein H0T18_07925 [Chloroflexia bacterium]|nr:hypothetical protein [Chloroflexia bacterium]
MMSVALMVALLSGYSVAFAAGASCPSPAASDGPNPSMSEVYASAAWYRDRPERELQFSGELVSRNDPVGPSGRAALQFDLLTENGPLPVYAPDNAHLLAPFAGQQVVVRAKLIDLSDEGFGPELWIAAIGIVR